METNCPESQRSRFEFTDGRTIRVLALMEATSVTGPAKNLIEFAVRAGQRELHVPRVELSIATFERRGTTGRNVFVCAARNAGIAVDVIHERFVFDPGVVRQIQQLVAAHKPDIIQTHNVKSHFLLRFSGMYRYCPWIAFQHGYTWPNLKMRLYNQLDRWSLPAADHVVTVCRAFALGLERTGIPSSRITVRHNSVRPFVPSTPEMVEEVRRRVSLSSGKAVVLVAGRLSKEKGHLDLIEAIARVRQSVGGGRFHVILAGDGPERAALERHIQALQLTSTVTLVGQQSDLRPFYTLADLIVLPSHSEGSPNVLLEAMAAGLSIVATAVGGVPEIAHDQQNALLINKCDPNAMADSIIRLLENDELRHTLGKAALCTAREYAPETYCASMLRLYAQVLQGGGES